MGILSDKYTYEEMIEKANKAVRDLRTAETPLKDLVIYAMHALRSGRSYTPPNDKHLHRAEDYMEMAVKKLGDNIFLSKEQVQAQIYLSLQSLPMPNNFALESIAEKMADTLMELSERKV